MTTRLSAQHKHNATQLLLAFIGIRLLVVAATRSAKLVLSINERSGGSEET